MKQPVFISVALEKIVGGGQALGTMADGRKVFTWGGLPGEEVVVAVTKKKAKFTEGIVSSVTKATPERTPPRDPESYLSTSPWQIMNFAAEQHYKAALIEEAFELHSIVLPQPITIYTNNQQFEYRNKIEYSFWYDTDKDNLSLAFFRRGTHGKIPISHTSLAHPAITREATYILDALNTLHVEGRALKTLLIRADQQGRIAWQLYVKDQAFPAQLLLEAIEPRHTIKAEIIYSHPQSPASVITKILTTKGEGTLQDTLLGIPFSYATEGFFQINLPIYEQALKDIATWIEPNQPLIDLYSGVGTIGLTVSKGPVTLVESNEHAVKEMQRNITHLGRQTATAILAPSEQALDSITADAHIVVDPPRAGLHDDVIQRLLTVQPKQIIYLSCNPVTQARDVAKLSSVYGIRAHTGYNFFPRTPHIEHLIILEKR